MLLLKFCIYFVEEKKGTCKSQCCLQYYMEICSVKFLNHLLKSWDQEFCYIKMDLCILYICCWSLRLLYIRSLLLDRKLPRDGVLTYMITVQN